MSDTESEFDAALGTWVIEIDVMLSADSGRPKHNDVEGQGMYVLPVIERGLRAVEFGPGAAFGSIRYMGAGRTDRAVLQEQEVGPYIGEYPVDEVRHQVWALQGLVSSMGELVRELLQREEDQDAVLHRLQTHRASDLIEVLEHLAGVRGIEEITFENWRQAMRDRP